MFNNVALDVFTGLVFIFLLYSLLATIIQEMIATRLAFRAKVLEKAIIRMLEDLETNNHRPFGDRIDGFLHILGLKNILKNTTVAPWFYAHPLIKYLGEDNYYSKPAYLHSRNFSKVILDLLKDFNVPESEVLQPIHNSIMAGVIHKLPINIANVKSESINPAIKILISRNAISQSGQKTIVPGPKALSTETVPLCENTAFFLKTLWEDSGADLTTFRTKLEDWFNDTMDRATGWYKKYTRVLLFILGLIIAYVFNVDTIAIHRILATNKPARDQLVQMAIANKNNLDPNNLKTDNDSILKVTYNIVAKDANDANGILGLGKPWKDSCKICKSILGTGSGKIEAKTKLDSLIKVKMMINSLRMTSDSIRKEKGFIDSLNKAGQFAVLSAPLQQHLDFLNKQAAINDSLLKLYPTKGLSEIDSLNTLLTRCPVISNAAFLQYSPNQAGGLETLLGWLITALAITLGAPFWFDLLSKLMSLRGAGKISPPANDDTPDSGNTNSPGAPAVDVTVNPNPGEEAVG
jgi:hypothetical protein